MSQETRTAVRIQRDRKKYTFFSAAYLFILIGLELFRRLQTFTSTAFTRTHASTARTTTRSERSDWTGGLRVKRKEGTRKKWGRNNGFTALCARWRPSPNCRPMFYRFFAERVVWAQFWHVLEPFNPYAKGSFMAAVNKRPVRWLAPRTRRYPLAHLSMVRYVLVIQKHSNGFHNVILIGPFKYLNKVK